jgi:hypothetical protein
MSVVSVVCCQVQVSAMGRTHFHKSSTECSVSEYDIETLTRRSLGPLALSNHKKQVIS